MKGFKKLALVTAIAAAPFANAELTSIDDSVLSEMTGQSGISIELDAQIEIGSITYTDTDQNGSLGIDGIRFGGSGAVDGFGDVDANNGLNDIKIDIDIDETAGLLIHLGGTDLVSAVSGSNPVDFGFYVNDVTLNGGLSLASKISIAGNLGPIDVAIANSGDIAVGAYFEVTSGGLDLDVLGLGITNLTIGDDLSPISSGIYQTSLETIQDGAEANLAIYKAGAVVAQSAGPGGVVYDAKEGLVATLAVNTDGNPATDVTQSDVDTAIATDTTNGNTVEQDALGLSLAEVGTYSGTVAATEQGVSDSVTAAVVRAGAISGVSNMAYAAMNISTVDATYFTGTTENTVTNALNIEITAMNMDIAMDLTLGSDSSNSAASLGHVEIQDLNLTNTSLTIYGH